MVKAVSYNLLRDPSGKNILPAVTTTATATTTTSVPLLCKFCQVSWFASLWKQKQAGGLETTVKVVREDRPSFPLEAFL